MSFWIRRLWFRGRLRAGAGLAVGRFDAGDLLDLGNVVTRYGAAALGQRLTYHFQQSPGFAGERDILLTFDFAEFRESGPPLGQRPFCHLCRNDIIAQEAAPSCRLRVNRAGLVMRSITAWRFAVGTSIGVTPDRDPILGVAAASRRSVMPH
jgi:hypothetical protein